MERADLAEELITMASYDLEIRQQLLDRSLLYGGYHAEMRAVHRCHGDRLEEILAEIECWPGYRLVGKEGSEAAFLVAQHDIANPALIRSSRTLYADAVKFSDADPRLLAQLEDRIRYFEGRLQKYGTHVGWNAAGEFGPWPPVEEPEHVDELRRQLGLVPLAQAIASAAEGRPPRRPVGDVLEEHKRGEEFAHKVGWRDED